MNTLTQQLEWRYATKRMTGATVPQEKIDAILEAIRLAPSSYGLAPYKVFVITNPEVRKKIQPTAWMQPQIVESSHLLIFAAWDTITEKNVDDYLKLIADTRGMDVAALDGFKQYIMGTVNSLDPAGKVAWASKQAYIALGMGLSAAAMEGVDSTPMEGFEPAKLDEVLGLKEKGLKSVVILALGYRDTINDASASYKKVRRAKEDLFITV
ncbi:MAG: NAD(P)H-dependent oxidoreductase [Patescibacteria group bacterium]